MRKSFVENHSLNAVEILANDLYLLSEFNAFCISFIAGVLTNETSAIADVFQTVFGLGPTVVPCG